MQADFPHVRSSQICPLCNGDKDTGLICCWSCYRERRVRDGNQEAETLIAKGDAKLMRDESLSKRRAD